MDSEILWDILKFPNFEYGPAGCTILGYVADFEYGAPGWAILKSWEEP